MQLSANAALDFSIFRGCKSWFYTLVGLLGQRDTPRPLSTSNPVGYKIVLCSARGCGEPFYVQ